MGFIIIMIIVSESGHFTASGLSTSLCPHILIIVASRRHISAMHSTYPVCDSDFF